MDASNELRLPGEARHTKSCFPQKGPLDLTQQGALHLFSGCCGVAKQLLRQGCPWVLTFDIKRGAAEDLLDKSNQDLIFELLKLGAFRSVGMAPMITAK